MIDFVLEQKKKASLNNLEIRDAFPLSSSLVYTAALSRVTAAGSLSITFITLQSTNKKPVYTHPLPCR